VNGHDHDMQPLRPIDGITEFVAGAGGRSLYPLDESDSRLAFELERKLDVLAIAYNNREG
jgi:hypothetical protein